MSEQTDWRHQAACRGEDPNRMQPEEATPDELASAMALCGTCPMAAWTGCHELARDQASAYGVHAGQWWGDPPRNPEVTSCSWCGEDAPSSAATYCSGRCRVAAHRARHALSA